MFAITIWVRNLVVVLTMTYWPVFIFLPGSTMLLLFMSLLESCNWSAENLDSWNSQLFPFKSNIAIKVFGLNI